MDISPFALALSNADPRLDSLRDSLFSALKREPVFHRDGSRAVTEALGLVRYVLDDATCTAHCEVRAHNGAWLHSNAAWRLDAPLPTWDWLDAFLGNAIGPPPRRGESHAEERALRVALKARLRVEATESRLLPPLRRRIVAAIPLDPDVRWLVDRLLLDSDACELATSLDYTEVWRSYALWTDLRNENEDLALLLRFLQRSDEDRAPAVADGFRGLKSHFLALNTGDAGWRLICRHARTLCANVLAAESGRDAGALIAVQARLLRGFHEALPRQELVTAVLRSAHLVERMDEIDVPHRLLELASAALADAWREERAEAFIEDEWLPMIAWVIETQPVFHRNQWARGWSAIVRAKSEWSLRELARTSAAEWTALPAPLELGPFEAIELDSTARLMVEGIEMAHCVADYADRCISGRSRIFSLRRRDTGRRVATVLFQSTPRGWRVWQRRGRANSALPDDVENAVMSIPAHVFPAPPQDDEFTELLASLEDDGLPSFEK